MQYYSGGNGIILILLVIFKLGLISAHQSIRVSPFFNTLNVFFVRFAIQIDIYYYCHISCACVRENFHIFCSSMNCLTYRKIIVFMASSLYFSFSILYNHQVKVSFNGLNNRCALSTKSDFSFIKFVLFPCGFQSFNFQVCISSTKLSPLCVRRRKKQTKKSKEQKFVVGREKKQPHKKTCIRKWIETGGNEKANSF